MIFLLFRIAQYSIYFQKKIDDLMVEDSSTFHSYTKIITKNEFDAILSTQEDSSFKIKQSLIMIFIFVKIIVNLLMD